MAKRIQKIARPSYVLDISSQIASDFISFLASHCFEIMFEADLHYFYYHTLLSCFSRKRKSLCSKRKMRKEAIQIIYDHGLVIEENLFFQLLVLYLRFLLGCDIILLRA